MHGNEQSDNYPVGFLLVNKPKEVPSFRIIAQIRRVMGNNKLKVGYAGTLDPFAQGLMIVGIGRQATKLLHVITKWPKRYIARAKLGQMTDTLDHTGNTIKENNTPITGDQLHQAIQTFGNQYEQIPPLYSALKHEGLPLYTLARKKGKTAQDLQEVLKKKSRIVTLHSLELIEIDMPFFTIATNVSHGTYIRTLVNDLADKAGSCATTYELARTSVGPINLDQAIDLNHLQEKKDVEQNLIAIETFVGRYFSDN